jgi:hypothetical protein
VLRSTDHYADLVSRLQSATERFQQLSRSAERSTGAAKQSWYRTAAQAKQACVDYGVARHSLAQLCAKTKGT